MDLGLNGRRALVGGGGSGIGAGIAAALAAEGARAALLGWTADRVGAEAAKLGGTAVVADLSTPDGPAAAVEAAVVALGGLDLVLVNTGGPATGTIESMTDAEWEVAIDGTLQSVLRLLLRRRAPALAGGRGSVDPDRPLVVGPRANSRVDGLECPASRPGRTDQVRAPPSPRRSGSTASRRAGSQPTGSRTSTAAARRRRA